MGQMSDMTAGHGTVSTVGSKVPVDSKLGTYSGIRSSGDHYGTGRGGKVSHSMRPVRASDMNAYMSSGGPTRI